MNTILRRRAFFVMLALFVCFSGTNLWAQLPQLSTGDFFVGLSDGTVQWFRSNGFTVKTLDTGNRGQAKGMAFDIRANLYVTHWFSPDLRTGNDLEVFNSNGVYVGKFGANSDCNPTSIDFDSKGNAYVGQADCEGDVMMFDSAGNLVARFAVDVENRGSTWLDLAPDDCTLFYTSAGPHVKRFDVCQNVQLPDFNPVPIDGEANAMQILGDGGALVAAGNAIYRFTPMGTLLTLFDISGSQCWYALATDSRTGRFMAGDYCGRSVYLFDLNSGALLVDFAVTTGDLQIKSVALVTEDVLAPPPPPIPPTSSVPLESLPAFQPEIVLPAPSPLVPAACRITGSGTIVTTAGVQVSFDNQLGAPANKQPQTLEVTWNGTTMRFHLVTLDSALCVDNPNINSLTSQVPYDMFVATGTGQLNGTPATIELSFTDGGTDTGLPDTATLLIKDENGQVALTVSAPLTSGDQMMQ